MISDAPPTVASFLQRMGRTGRRGSRNCLFLATTNEALLITAGILRLWSEGFVEQIVPSPRPLHILAQQILSLVLQQSGLPENTGPAGSARRSRSWGRPRPTRSSST